MKITGHYFRSITKTFIIDKKMKIQFKNRTMNFRIQVLKSLLILVILFTSFLAAFSQTKEMNIPIKPEVKWFMDARFGMFIHWSPMAAIDKEIGWSWGYEVDSTSYVNRCKAWNPTKFDANAWVTLAKNAGMKYIVFVL